MVEVLVAPDKFKGSLSARQVADALAAGLRTGDPGLQVTTMPVADGGDGTVAAVVAAGATPRRVRVTGPVGRPVDAEFALLRDVAVVELAQASGLALLKPDEFAPLEAGSAGTGELIRAALDLEATEIVLGVGGSACTDGGTGLLTALGARFLDSSDRPVAPGGGALRSIVTVDLSGLDPRLSDVPLTLASDVTNPLLGPEGAADVYGPQKGADREQVAVLADGLAHLAAVLAGARGPAVLAATESPGAGAAGGVGFAALAVLGARQRPGIDLVLELAAADEMLSRADLVVTGEGRLDDQTLAGKAPAGIVRAAARHGVPVLAVTGSCRLGAEERAAAGFIDVLALDEREPDLARCMAEGETLLRLTGEELARRHLRTASWARQSQRP